MLCPVRFLLINLLMPCSLSLANHELFWTGFEIYTSRALVEVDDEALSLLGDLRAKPVRSETLDTLFRSCRIL